MLEEFCRSKEQRCCLLRPKSLSHIEQIDNPRQESPAFPWTDWRIIEDTSLLDDCGFVVVVRAQTALVLLLGGEGQG